MDETTRQRLLGKNQALINMVIERARHDFPDDIAIIGLTGSFQTGDYHEHSDLDLIIINETERGWKISECFILSDVGYDIYCTPWKPRIEDASTLESAHASHLLDLQILYCANDDALERFEQYRQNALRLLGDPIGAANIARANRHINEAKQTYADALLNEDLGAVRYAAGCTLLHCLNALVSLNNTYIKRGTKRYLEELLGYEFLPDDFEQLYMAVIKATTVADMRDTSSELIKNVIALRDHMKEQFVQRPTPIYDNLGGTYEELWCNYRNKVIQSTESGDLSYAFHTALGVQGYLDEMTEIIGTKTFDLMKCFDPNDLGAFKTAFLNAMDEYLEYYNQVGRSVIRFEDFNQLYEHFMKMPDSE